MRASVIAVALLVTANRIGIAQQLNSRSGLSGVVVDTVDSPVQFAQVAIVNGALGATTDDGGRFRLSNLVSGKNIVEVRRIGYVPVYFQVDIPEAVNIEVRIKMTPAIATLAHVDVTDVRDPLRRVGFYDRMAAGIGYFLSPEMLSRLRPLRATDAFMNIPNVAVDRRGNKSRVMTANYRCEYGMVIDNVLVGEAGSRVRTTSPDDLVSASDLYAIEVYPRNRGLPLRFLGMAHEDGCGTIVIWTRGMIPR